MFGPSAFHSVFILFCKISKKRCQYSFWEFPPRNERVFPPVCLGNENIMSSFLLIRRRYGFYDLMTAAKERLPDSPSFFYLPNQSILTFHPF